jgi:transcriptional regulator with XRE-family HTH domain
MRNAPFIAALRDRGLTQEALAERIGSSRAHVCQVLNGVEGRGGYTRKKLARHLTARELDLLGWDALGRVRCST